MYYLIKGGFHNSLVFLGFQFQDRLLQGNQERRVLKNKYYGRGLGGLQRAQEKSSKSKHESGSQSLAQPERDVTSKFIKLILKTNQPF